jgi:hypothetical protein
MSSALSISAGGIRTATAQFERAARDIVAAGTTAAPQNSAAPGPGASGGAPIRVAQLPAPDLAEGIVSLKLAEISYKANLKVFEVAARLEEEALNILT